MKPVKLYTTRFCGFCHRAKMLLDNKGIPYEDIDVTFDGETRQTVAQQTGHRTVPMIFIGEQFIGGCNELYQLEGSGQLDEMLAL